ncbi:MAG: helix-turn-helix domain-containing protein [Anaerolineales bacterium]
MATVDMSLGEKVNILFEVIVKPNGKPYSNREVAREIGLSDGALSIIRNKKTNAIFNTLQEIARFFDVPLDYFNCETRDECYAFLAELTYRRSLNEAPPSEHHVSPVVKQIVVKAMTMSDNGQRELLRITEWLQTADQSMQERETAQAG